MNMTNVLKSRSVRLNPKYFTCTVRRKRVELTPDMYAFLYLLMSHPRRVFRRAEILQLLEHPATPKSVDVCVHKIRHRIGFDLIRTVQGVGYSFMESVERGKLRL